MKKYIITFLLALMVFTIPSAKAVELPKKTNHEKVKIHLFYASWCPHCHDFIKYFGDKYTEYEDYFEIVTYQVDDNDKNSALMDAVGKVVGETEGYIPLIIVGDSYHVSGFGEDGTPVIEAALKEYQNKKYVDIVAKVMKEQKLESDAKTFLDACKITNISCTGYQAVETTDTNNESTTDPSLPAITDHEKVKIYLFYASWCPHCHDFLKYFSSRYEKYQDYFEIVTIQGDEANNSANGELMQTMATYFGLEKVGYPLIIIGSDFKQSGFGSDGTNIIETALSEYQNANYKDVVKEKITEGKLENSVTQKDLLQACDIAGIDCSVSAGGGELIAVIIIAVVIAGFSSLLYFGRKNK